MRDQTKLTSQTMANPKTATVILEKDHFLTERDGKGFELSCSVKVVVRGLVEKRYCFEGEIFSDEQRQKIAEGVALKEALLLEKKGYLTNFEFRDFLSSEMRYN